MHNFAHLCILDYVKMPLNERNNIPYNFSNEASVQYGIVKTQQNPNGHGTTTTIEYSSTEPAYTDVGEYTVYYKISADNHDVVTGEIAYTINPVDTVIGAWTNTSVVYNGSNQAPAMTSFTGLVDGDANPSVTFTYGEDSSVSAAGTYTATATLEDTNYTLTNPTATFIISKAPVTFTINPDTGVVTASEEIAFTFTSQAGTKITIPGDPGESGHDTETFVGWSYDETIYKADETFTQPSKNVEFTAEYQYVYHIGGTVYQKTEDGTDTTKVDGAVVTLMSGSNQIAQDTTDENGEYDFSGVPAGTYNIVVSYNGITQTTVVTIEGEDDDTDVSLPYVSTNSIVTVTAGTPDVVVDGLDDQFTEDDIKHAIEEGQSIELWLTVDQATVTAEEEETETNVAVTLDITISKTTTSTKDGIESSETESITEVDSLLKFIIPIPAEYQGKSSYYILRTHDYDDGNGDVTEYITTKPNDFGECITVNEEKTEITLYAKYFSTYALYCANASSGVSYFNSVVADTDNGTAELSAAKSQLNEIVTITPAADAGYQVSSVVVSYGNDRQVEVTNNGDGTYSYKQVGATMTVTVNFAVASNFEDVDATDWFYDAVMWAVKNGITEGTSATTYSPDSGCTRAELVTFLYRYFAE